MIALITKAYLSTYSDRLQRHIYFQLSKQEFFDGAAFSLKDIRDLILGSKYFTLVSNACPTIYPETYFSYSVCRPSNFHQILEIFLIFYPDNS